MKLKFFNRSETILLVLHLLFCLGLITVRILLTNTTTFAFLVWNLFLGVVPFVLIRSIKGVQQFKVWPQRIVSALLVIVWLLFFPNAPYILTDLFHLNKVNTMPVWFDLVLLLSFAWTSLLFGFLSLKEVERILKHYFSRKLSSIIMMLLLFLSSFGVYLGRFLRWNSWDIINEPGGLMFDILNRFVYPFYHQRTWGVTLLYGVLLNLIYWGIKLFNQEREEQRFFINNGRVRW